MKKIKVAFVILHYQAIEMTKKCVDNLYRTFDMSENFIVIVDNASPNNSGKELLEIYSDSKNIKIIISSENLGFAKGNNLGFSFIKENYNFDFLIIMNNDILINQKDFIEKIYKLYEQKQFDILGPDIYNPNLNYHQNPLRLNPLSTTELLDKKEALQKQFKFYYFFKFKRNLGLLKRKFFAKKTQQTKRTFKYDNSKTYISPVLHGACLIFSKAFCKKRKYAFYPETFMFWEEDVLDYECRINNFSTIYSPEINVIHLEDVSTNTLFSNESKKELWKLKEMLNSISIFIDYKKKSQKN